MEEAESVQKKGCRRGRWEKNLTTLPLSKGEGIRNGRPPFDLDRDPDWQTRRRNLHPKEKKPGGKVRNTGGEKVDEGPYGIFKVPVSLTRREGVRVNARGITQQGGHRALLLEAKGGGIKAKKPNQNPE